MKREKLKDAFISLCDDWFDNKYVMDIHNGILDAVGFGHWSCNDLGIAENGFPERIFLDVDDEEPTLMITKHDGDHLNLPHSLIYYSMYSVITKHFDIVPEAPASTEPYEFHFTTLIY